MDYQYQLKNKSELIDEEINVNGKKYNATSILVGVPHTVIFVDDENFDVSEGRILKNMSFLNKVQM